MSKKFKKLLATIFATTTFCSSVSYCMEKEEKEIVWPSYSFPFLTDDNINKILPSASGFISSIYNDKKFGLVENKNGKCISALFEEAKKARKNKTKKQIYCGIPNLIIDAMNGGYNACVFLGVYINEIIKDLLGSPTCLLSSQSHAVALGIKKGGQPVVFECYENEDKSQNYESEDLISYLEERRNQGDINVCEVGAVSTLPTANFYELLGAIRVNLYLRMVVLCRLKAYLKDKNDTQALEDAKGLVNYISKMENSSIPELWPICTLCSKTSLNGLSSIIFPPYDDLKKLFDAGQYDEYIKAELPQSLFLKLYDIAQYNPTERRQIFSDVVKHLQKPLVFSMLFMLKDDYSKFIEKLNENKITSYSGFYNYLINASALGTFGFTLVIRKDNINTLNNVIFDIKNSDDPLVRYEYPIDYVHEKNKELEEQHDEDILPDIDSI